MEIHFYLHEHRLLDTYGALVTTHLECAGKLMGKKTQVLLLSLINTLKRGAFGDDWRCPWPLVQAYWIS